jgi:serine/threonine protein kinase
VDLGETVQTVPNKLCPLGKLERRNARWQRQEVLTEVIELTVNQWKAWEKSARCELMIAQTIRHPHLQEVYGIFYTGAHSKKPQPCLAVVMESHRPEEMLAAHLQGASRRLTENQAFHITTDLVNVLVYLHANGTIHRHIIPENVLVQQKAVGFIGKLAGLFTARVACRVFYSPMVRQLTRAEAMSWSIPEDRRSLSLASVNARPADMRDLGLVLLQLWAAVSEDLASRPPSQSAASRSSTLELTGVEEAVQRDNSLQGDDALLAVIRDTSMRHFVSCLLAEDPSQRPSAKQAQHMLFIRQDSETLKLPDVHNDSSRTSPLVDLAAEGLLSVGVV